MENNTSPPQMYEYNLCRRLLDLATKGAVTAEQLNALTQPDLVVCQIGEAGHIHVAKYLTELTAGITRLTRLRTLSNEANLEPESSLLDSIDSERECDSEPKPKQSNGFPWDSKFHVTVGSPNQQATTVPQYDLEQYQYDPQAEQLWRYAYKPEVGYRWVICTQNLPTAYLDKVRKAWLAENTYSASTTPLEEAHLMIRAIMQEHDISGAIAETEADRLFLLEMLEIHRERKAPKPILEHPKLQKVVQPPVIGPVDYMSMDVIRDLVGIQLGAMGLKFLVKYDLVRLKSKIVAVTDPAHHYQLARALHMAGYLFKNKNGCTVAGLLIKKYAPSPFA